MEELNFTLNKFIRSFKPLRKLPLTLSEVNAIEYILSYQLHESDIIISNKAVGKYLMMKTKSATNLLNGLAMKGYISIDKNNLKNPDEEPTRYLTVNIAFINEMLVAPRTTKIPKSDNNKHVSPITEERIIEVVELMHDTSTEDTDTESFLGGNYPIEDNEYSRMLYGDKFSEQAQEIAIETVIRNKSKPSALDFDELRIIALLSKHTEHLRKVTARFPDFIYCLGNDTLSNEHIQDLKQFHEAMLLDEKLRNEYRSIE